MANPEDAPANNSFELTCKESSSSVGVRNPELVKLIYALKPHVFTMNVSHGSSWLRLDSSGDECDLLLREIATRIASLDVPNLTWSCFV